MGVQVQCTVCGGGTCGCHVRVLRVPSSVGPPHRPVGALPVNVCQAQPGLKCLEPLPQLPWVHLPSQHGVSGAWVRGRRHCHRPAHTWCRLSRCGPFGYSFSPSFACNPLRAQMSALSLEVGTCSVRYPEPGGAQPATGLPKLPGHRPWWRNLPDSMVPRQAERHGPTPATGGRAGPPDPPSGCPWDADGAPPGCGWPSPGWERPVFRAYS